MTKENIHLSEEERERIRAKRLEERNKRLRKDGLNQYMQPTGGFAHFKNDLHTPLNRDPQTKQVEFIMIGGGFAGLCIGAALRDIGLDDFYIIEDGGDFGGVWYWNRYPGAMCDTSAMIYLPLLEETGYMPSMKYITADEIWNHAKRIGRHYHLYEKALFSTHVKLMTWDQAASLWIVETNRGDRLTTKYIALGVGHLNEPKLPRIPGMELFAGCSFHTTRWDYNYTGGNSQGAPMVKLKDKRVGIIGTGATGVQCIPPLARDAREVFVFQRTPSAINERLNSPIDPTWYQGLEKGWQKKWVRNFAALQSPSPFDEEDLVQDGWTEIYKNIRFHVVDLQKGPTFTAEDILRGYHRADDEKMEQLRRRVDSIIVNPHTAESLKAWYRQLCKRPCFHDEYLPTFNQSNVHLIDTLGKGVQRIDANGIWVNDTHYDLDCLIYASGFFFQSNYTKQCSFEIIGRESLTLAQKWANGMESYQGMHVHGFPNMFIIGVVQGANLRTNVTSNYTEATPAIRAILKHAKAVGAREVEASSQAEKAWVKIIEESNANLADSECTPGFYNSEGQPIGRYEKLHFGGFPAGPSAFFDYMDKWLAEGHFVGLEFR